ncbi:MAG: sulfurtransferase TusA family protein [Myxococcales bacterium]|nr:sulfurtransferase TusA family protein [Myxococcota bacterium]MDW8280685.1 sulfurtransferase TusA family protein [Myxococcales bacterium]
MINNPHDSNRIATTRLDVRGRGCPIPIVHIMNSIEKLKPGETIEVMATDHAFPKDVEAWCKRTGHILLECKHNGEHYVAFIKKKPS